mgnify:CR=1 FL=1
MNVKEAVELAKRHIVDIYAAENVTNVGLEEVDFDEAKGIWYVTIGFSRPWDEPRNALAALAAQGAYTKRVFKTLRVADNGGQILSIKNRDTAA